MALQHLRSNTASKRPTAAAMSDGQIAVNTNATSPGLFFKDAGGTIVKVGPVHVGTSAPNSSPAAGGSTGNSVGEQWLDTSGGSYVFKVWDGSAWRSEAGEFVDVAGDTMTGDLTISGADQVMSNGEIIAATGTAAAPSITFTGDTNTGLYSPGADQVAVSTGGTGRLFIDGSGNVGIGTTNPQSTLEIYRGTISVTDPNSITTGDTGVYGAIWSEDAALTQAGFEIAFNTGSNNARTERMRIDGNGNVGIGTTAPNELIDVRGNSNPQIKVSETNNSTSAGFYIENQGQRNWQIWADRSSDQLRIGNNSRSATNFVITPTNNVGIGTTSPNERFSVDVNGSTNRAVEIYNSDTVLADGELVHAIRFTQNDVSNPNTTHASIETVTTGSTGLLNMVFRARDNTEYMRINTSGNVGIGTSNPVTTLHVKDTVSTTTVLESTANQSLINFRNSATSLFYMGITNNNWNVQTNAIERLSVTTGGNVGIGTTSPQYPLDVSGNIRFGAGSGYALLQYGSDTTASDNWHVGSEGDGSFRFYNGVIGSGSERMRITSDGNVGIGLTNPVSLLHTSGTRDYTGTTPSASSYDVNFVSGTAGVGIGQSDGTPSIQGYGAGTAYNLALCPNNGKVGIGTTNPQAKLEVLGNTTGTSVQVLGNAATDYTYLQARNPSGVRLQLVGNGNTDAQVRGVSNHPLAFHTNNAEKMRIDSSGRLLVGTTSARTNFFNSGISPGLQLEGAGGLGDHQRFVSITNNYATGGDGGGYLVLARNKSNTLSSNVLVAQNDQLGAIAFQGNDGSEFVIGARIEGYVDGTPGANDMPGRLVFSTTADGASSPTERMRITNNGELRLNTGGGNVDVGFGTTDGVTFYNPSNPAAGSIQISTNGGPAMYLRRRTSNGIMIDFRKDTTSVGNISVTTTSTTYNTSSDYRLKENVVPLTGAVNRLNQLQVRRFNFIADPDTTVDGFLAHEAQAVVPECVTGEKDEVDDEGNPVYQGIDQSKIVPLLTAALQEALAKIETLEQRLTDAGL